MRRVSSFAEPIDATALPSLPLPRVALAYFGRQFCLALAARIERGEKAADLAGLCHDAIADVVRGHETLVMQLAKAFAAEAVKRAEAAGVATRDARARAKKDMARLAKAEAEAATIQHEPAPTGARGR